MPKVKKDKLLFLKETETVNENGEVLNKKNEQTILIAPEPNYIKLYIDTVLTFKELPITLNPILNELLKRMSYANYDDPNGGQIVRVTGYDRNIICKNLDIKLNTLVKAITNLCKHDILRRIGGTKSSAYQVNPYIFGKGEWKDIKAIRATFDFNTGEIITDFKTTGQA